jgi:peptidoglycan endopeptidase LytE
MREFSTGASSNRYDPYFSKWTKAAVQRFQRANKLGADGIVGAATWRALRS